MSCTDKSPCLKTSCCTETSPCYDDCGCLNPTTFDCLTYVGDELPCLDVADGEKGSDILPKIEAKICDIGKVMFTADDSCPDYLSEKITAGLNIDISYEGTGCDQRMVISATEGGVPVDVNVSVSENDLSTGYLYDKVDPGEFFTKSITNPGGNEILRLDLEVATLISGDAGNQITLGVDGGLKTTYTAPDGSETILAEGTGTTVTGTGTTDDPYIISTNPSIQVARPCFDSIWRPIILVASGNANVTYTAGAPQYRYRFDGSIEFKGSISYTVNFGAYSTGNRSFTIPMGTIATTCITAGEQIGTADLKSITYIDIPQASADQITQQYGYIVRKSAQNMSLVFQSSFTGTTSKSVVVNLEGCVSHPSL